MSADAKAIYQTLLETTQKALFERDSDTWMAQMSSPFLITTTDGRLLIDTPEAFRKGMFDFVDALTAQGIVRIQRDCIVARQTDPVTIIGYHTVQHFDENNVPSPGLEVKWTLHKNSDGKWRVAKSDVSTTTRRFTQARAAQFDGYSERNLTPAQEDEKLAQALMDSVDQVFLSGDVSGWMHLFLLPFRIQSANGHKVLKTRQDVYDEYDATMQEMRDSAITDCLRKVEQVERPDETTMIITFRAHMLRNGRYAVPPWQERAHFRLCSGFWRAFAIDRPHSHTQVLPPQID